MAFSTRDDDRDNDKDTGWSCAQCLKGGWWYNSSYDANMNGVYFDRANNQSAEGINWGRWYGYDYSLKTTAMKIRLQYKHFHVVIDSQHFRCRICTII